MKELHSDLFDILPNKVRKTVTLAGRKTSKIGLLATVSQHYY